MVIGKFGTGKLEVGEVIMAYGHPHDYIGSGCVGKNFYPCIANTPTNFSDLRCKDYVIDPLSNQSRFRVMGDVWNQDSLARAKNEPNVYGTNLNFEKNLLAMLPIIQAGGMVCGSGASGAPIFNFDREIVGMHVYGIKGYEVEIHVSGLQAFLDSYLVKQSGGGGGGQGGGGGKPVKEAYGKGKPPSKNRKRHRQ